MAFRHMAFSPGDSRLHIIFPRAFLSTCTLIHLRPPSKLDTSNSSHPISISLSLPCAHQTKPNPNQLHHQARPSLPKRTLFSTVVLHSTSDLRSPPPKKEANTDHVHANHRPSPNANNRHTGPFARNVVRKSPVPQVYRLFKKGKERREEDPFYCPFLLCLLMPTLLNQPRTLSLLSRKVLMAKDYFSPCWLRTVTYLPNRASIVCVSVSSMTTTMMRFDFSEIESNDETPRGTYLPDFLESHFPTTCNYHTQERPHLHS